MNQIRVALDLGMETVGDGLSSVGGMSGLEASRAKPGIYVLSPEDAQIVALAEWVEYHETNPIVHVDHSRLSPPHSEVPEPTPGKIPPEQLIANGIRRDGFLGALSLAVGRRTGHGENDYSIAA